MYFTLASISNLNLCTIDSDILSLPDKSVSIDAQCYCRFSTTSSCCKRDNVSVTLCELKRL